MLRRLSAIERGLVSRLVWLSTQRLPEDRLGGGLASLSALRRGTAVA
jgi:hypothetical protein